MKKSMYKTALFLLVLIWEALLLLHGSNPQMIFLSARGENLQGFPK